MASVNQQLTVDRGTIAQSNENTCSRDSFVEKWQTAVARFARGEVWCLFAKTFGHWSHWWYKFAWTYAR